MTQRRSVLVWLPLQVLGLVSAAPGAPAQISDPILIGAPVHLTGFMATYDVPPLEGARLAVKQVNGAGGVLGRQLQIIERDGKSDPATLSTATREVIAAGAEVLVTPSDFEMGAPAAEVAQEAGIVGISFCASSPLYGAEVLGDMQFTLSMWNQTMAAAAAEFAYNDQGWTTAATIVDQGGEYTKSLAEFFAVTFEHLGGKVIIEDTYQPNDLQATGQARRLKELDPQPDVIFIASNMPDYPAIIRDVRAAGVTAPIMGGDSMDTSDFYKSLGPELGHEIFLATHSFVGPEAGPAMEQFVKDFNTEYGRDPETAFTAMGWDTIQVIAQGIEEAGTTDGAALAKALEGLEFHLLSGTLVWSDAASGHVPEKEVFIIEVRDGTPTFVTRTKPSWTPEA